MSSSLQPNSSWSLLHSALAEAALSAASSWAFKEIQSERFFCCFILLTLLQKGAWSLLHSALVEAALSAASSWAFKEIQLKRQSFFFLHSTDTKVFFLSSFYLPIHQQFILFFWRSHISLCPNWIILLMWWYEQNLIPKQNMWWRSPRSDVHVDWNQIGSDTLIPHEYSWINVSFLDRWIISIFLLLLLYNSKRMRNKTTLQHTMYV